MNTSKATSVLRKSWLRLKSKEPRLWSLRQVARETKVSPGYLSKIFQKQKPLQWPLAKKLLTSLRVDGINKEIVLSAFNKIAPKKRVNYKTNSSLATYELPPETSEWILARWYNLSLLDLMTTEGFVNDPEWMARRLGITIQEAKDSLKKLVETGLATFENGVYNKKHKKIRFPTSFSKAMFREHHKSQMRRAIAELENRITPKEFNDRLIVSVTTAANPKRLEEIKNFLHLVLFEAAEMLSEENCSEVYQINLQLFPQTIIRK